MIPESLRHFPLAWRWTDKKYCVLSESELNQIAPLDPNEAQNAWLKSLQFLDKDHAFRPNPLLFRSIVEIDATDALLVASWLRSRMKGNEIIISWQPDLAVKSTTSLFVQHWNDFCYPASDDVSIWPTDESWVIHYWHEEVFYFGESRAQ